MKKLFLKLLFFVIFFPISIGLVFFLFNPIFTATSLIFPYAIHPFDIVSVYPSTWILLKKLYVYSFFISYLILFNKLFNTIYTKFPTKISINLLTEQSQNSDLSLLVGLSNNIPIFISEKGLYQNILITGTIGSR